jgi:hypothetical protein
MAPVLHIPYFLFFSTLPKKLGTGPVQKLDLVPPHLPTDSSRLNIADVCLSYNPQGKKKKWPPECEVKPT